MGTIVIKPDRDVDFYVGWSSIVEAPVWCGTRADVIPFTEDEARNRPSSPPAERLARADHNGTSAFDGDGGWDDTEGFIYEQRGWLRRDRLAEACRLLLAENEAAVWDLLDPFEDEAEVRRG